MKNDALGSTDLFLDPVTGRINNVSFPELQYGYVWVGDKHNEAQARPELLDIKIDLNTLKHEVKNKSVKILIDSEVRNHHVPIFTHQYQLDVTGIGRRLQEDDIKYIHSSPVSISPEGEVKGITDLHLDNLYFSDYKDTFVRLNSEGKLVPTTIDIPTEFDFAQFESLKDKLEKAVSLSNTFALVALAAATYGGGGGHLHCHNRFVVNRGNIISHNNFSRKGFMFCDLDVNQIDDKYKAYVDGSGSFIVSSSYEDKHLIKKLEDSALNKLSNLNVYTYCPMFHLNDEDHYHDKDRKYYKSLHVEVGLLAEEVKAFFPDAVDQVRLADVSEVNSSKLHQMSGGYQPTLSAADYLAQKNNNEMAKGVNYNRLLCYNIMAIKELKTRLEALESKGG